MEKKHLSEVLSVEEIINAKENRICILAGVGAGKNHFVTQELRGQGNIFFVTSRRATVNEMLLNEICKEKVDWEKFDNEIFTTTNYGVELLVKNKKFSTTGIKNIIEHYDMIIIDEFHSLKADATFADSTFHLYTFLKYVSEKYSNIKIIVMTGTVEPVKDILKRDNYKIIDKMEDCINVIPKKIEVIQKNKAIEIMQELPENQKTIYYTNAAHESVMKVKNSRSLYARICSNQRFNEHNIMFAMADSTALDIMKRTNSPVRNEKTKKYNSPKNNDITNENRHINDLNRKVRILKKYLVSRNRLPEKTKILITTSTLKEGINIKSKDIKVAFCESHLLSDIQQFSGRIRTGLDTLYIINDGKQFDIDDQQHSKNFMEVLFDTNLLNKINEFFNKEIKNENSVIYHKEYGKFNPDEIKIYHEFLSDDFSIYSVTESAQNFINLIESKFTYIRFNHLESKFEPFITAYREQMRIYEYYASGWEKTIRKFCNKNNIEYINDTVSKEVDVNKITEKLKSILGEKLKTKESKNELIQFLKTEFGLQSKKPQRTTCNKKLKEYNIPYAIYEGHTTDNAIQTRYFEVRSIDWTVQKEMP